MSESLSWDIRDKVCSKTIEEQFTETDSFGNSTMTSSVRLELVDRDQCCQEFGNNVNADDFFDDVLQAGIYGDDFYGACDFVEETLSEDFVYDDGSCFSDRKFVANYNLSTGVTVY